MQRSTHLRCLAGILAITPGFAHAAALGDDDGNDGALGDFPQDEVDFHFGDHCEKLEELSFDAVLMLTVGARDRSRERFCAVDAPAECADFSWSIDEFGTLAPAATAGFCRFVPRPIRRQAPAHVLRNFG